MNMNWWIAAEKNRQFEQDAFDRARSQVERNKLGQFPTPIPLASQIVAVARSYQTLLLQEIRLLEPAAGLGAFYSAFLNESAGHAPKTAVGFEVDETVIELSEKIWAESNFELKHQDFTLAPPPTVESEKFNLLITNPPYVRHHHLSREDKQRLGLMAKRILGYRPSGLMGFYGYFLLAAHHWMQEDAIAAWLIPVEFMDVAYGKALKDYLTSQVEVLRIHRFDAANVQFNDAYVTSAIIFFRNRRPTLDHLVAFTTGESLKEPQDTCSISIKELKGIRKWTAVGHPTPASIRQTKSSATDFVTVGDLFNVKRGIATGANKFFIMSLSEAKRRELPDNFLRPVLPSPRYLNGVKVIESDAAGIPIVEPRLVLLDCVMPRALLAEKHLALHQYLQEAEQEGLHERYLLSRREPWYRQEERTPAPILCSYMGRKNDAGTSVKFFRNKSQATATNVYLLLYPKAQVLKHCQQPGAFIDTLFHLLLKLDQSEIVYQGRTYGGGLDKVEPNELKRVVLGTREELRDYIADLDRILRSPRPEGATQISLPFSN